MVTTMKYLLILILIVLIACDSKTSYDLECGESKYGINGELLEKIRCDSSLNLIHRYKRLDDDTELSIYENYKIGIVEKYENQKNQKLKYTCEHNDSCIFSIRRLPGYSSDPKKEIVSGNCLIPLDENDTDSTFVRKYFVTYPGFADNVLLSTFHINKEMDKTFLHKDMEIHNRKIVLIFNKKESLQWEIILKVKLNSGNEYFFKGKVE